MKKILIKFLHIILFSIFTFNCGETEKKNTKTISKVENVQGADSSVSAELGGDGFEEIASKLGYQTYIIKPEEEIYFGDPSAIKGGRLNYIHTLFPRTMRIHGQNSSQVLNIRTIDDLCYQPLLDLHPVTLEFIPALASHWKISDDKMQFWFRIDPTARWSDGKRVIAEDVVATWDLLMDETILAPSTQITYGKFERPIAESLYIVSVIAKSLDWMNMLNFANYMTLHPAHYLNDLDGTAFIEEYLFKMIPGTGPYIIYEKDIINQESYTLTLRENFWGNNNPFYRYMYNFDKIKISIVKDNYALEFEKLKKGEHDFKNITASRVWVEECDFEATQKGWLKKQKVYSNKPPGTSSYSFNMRKWPFDDKRVRYAFSYLYNREQMNREMYFSEYGMMNSLYSGTPFENPNNEKFHHNPQKAVDLLNEAGYTKRNDKGWLIQESSGRILRFEIQIPKTYDYMVTPVQQMMKEYGIDMQIKFVDYNTMIKNVNERNFTVAYLQYAGAFFPNPEVEIHSSLADKNDNNNTTGFKNKRVDELISEYKICFDLKKRFEIIREIDGIFNEVHPKSFTIVRNYIRMMWWDKFGYPEWMFEKNRGDRWGIFKYWWKDPEKESQLKQAMDNNISLPLLEIENKYWPNYNRKVGI